MKYEIVLSPQARVQFHTKHGKPAGVLTGFATEDEWFDFQLENDPRFLKKIEESRAEIRAGQGIPWERVKQEDDSCLPAPIVRAG